MCFGAGIKEVLDTLEVEYSGGEKNHFRFRFSEKYYISVPKEVWQLKLKEWGI